MADLASRVRFGIGSFDAPHGARYCAPVDSRLIRTTLRFAAEPTSFERPVSWAGTASCPSSVGPGNGLVRQSRSTGRAAIREKNDRTKATTAFRWRPSLLTCAVANGPK